MLALIFAVGLTAFALTTLYMEQDIAAPLRIWLGNRLARLGWTEMVKDDPSSLMRAKHRGFFRFIWSVQACPYCLATWVALGASVFALQVHPWHRSFWLLWWAATGLSWTLLAWWKLGQEMVEEIGARRDATEAPADEV